jgi:serine protease Do
VQQEVQRALIHVKPALVALEVRMGGLTQAASGVIATPDGLVLTAAHVCMEGDEPPAPGKRLKAMLADGRVVMATSLGLDLATDAAMLQLDGERTDWPFATMKRSKKPDLGEWCFALGHPGGYDRARGDVLRVGKVLKVMPNGLQTDCVLMGGDSGGPLFALDGEIIGIHSQIWEGRDQNVHVSLVPYLRSWDALKDGAIIREWGHGAGGWLGVKTRIGESGRLEVGAVADASPAARAGLRSGDEILSVDGVPATTQQAFSSAISSKPAGDPVVLVTSNRSGQRILTIKLGPRPPE